MITQYDVQQKRALPLTGRKRRRVLERIQTIWIKGLLEPSLSEMPTLDTRWQYQTAGQGYPWEPATPLPSSQMRLIDMFDRIDGHLLIQGEAGAGKTTLLLQLLRDLLARARREEFPLPCVLHLSHWNEKQQLQASLSRKRLSIEQWLIIELGATYRLSKRQVRFLLQTGQLVLLLDGLDELPARIQNDFLMDLDTFWASYSQIRTVLCWINLPFQPLPHPLLRASIIRIQPLTDGDIDAFLAEVPESLYIIGNALTTNPVLHEMARRPLVLFLLTLISDKNLPTEMEAKNEAELSDRLFATAVQRLLVRKNDAPSLPNRLLWLAWLARRLQASGQATFSLEQLQSKWLPLWGKLIYGILISVAYLFIIGLCCDLIAGSWHSMFSLAMLGWLFPLVCIFMGRTVPKQMVTSSASMPLISMGWLFAIWLAPVTPLLHQLSPLGDWISLGLHVLSGLIIVILFLGINLLLNRSLAVAPDRKIRQAGQYALSMLLLNIVLTSWYGGLIHGWTGVVDGLRLGTFSGITYGMVLGGDAYLEHFLLRFVCWSGKYMPWRYVTFLDEMVECGLLYQVSRSYLFRHHLLQNYLASLLPLS